jgi:hypothetical protein
MTEYKIHISAEALEEYDITELKNSIEAKGQLVPILVWNGQIVDGRHRYRACMELGLEVEVRNLPKETKEEDLPRVVLDAQLLRRGNDITFASCEVVLYLERSDEQIKEVVERYPDVNKDAVMNLKKIKEVRPVWFQILRQKKKVEWEQGKYSDSLRKLADICKEELKGIDKPLQVNQWIPTTTPDKLAELKDILRTIKDSNVDIKDIIDFLELSELEQEVELLNDW